LPLLSHTGWENALPTINPDVADPMLLVPALKLGVRVIAAHCGTRSMPWNSSFLPQWVQLAREYEDFYGDTSALNLPSRSYAYDTILADAQLRAKLVHGSDWPIMPVPPAHLLGIGRSLELLRDPNWLRRDIQIKRELGLDQAYWDRASTILRLPSRKIG
jgi:hypothetical protein